MQRAADLLGMDRRQADRIRDLQRGQFLGLGPAVSRRPVAVNVGSVRTGGKNAAQALMPLPEATGDEMQELLTDNLVDAVADQNTPRPAPVARPAVDLEQALSAVAAAPLVDEMPQSSAPSPDPTMNSLPAYSPPAAKISP